MAKEFHVKGLNTPRMAAEAANQRYKLGVKDAEFVDILDILEFRLQNFYPGFKLVVKRDGDLESKAAADIPNNQILVRETVYLSAYEGDPDSRFALAHELGHFLLHQEKNSVMHKTYEEDYEGISGLRSDESTEDQADMFARHFLVSPGLAFRFKDNAPKLASITGTPLPLAKGSITISKRLEMRSFVVIEKKQEQDSFHF